MNYTFRAVSAILLSILMITGIVAPAAALSEPTTLDLDDGPSIPIVETDRSALEHRLVAYQLVKDEGDSRHLVALNATLDRVVDANRVDARLVFHEDRRVIAQTQVDQPEVAEHLVASDQVLASTALDDAERVAAMLDERGLDYNETLVDEELAEARVALELGHRHAEEGRLVAAANAYHEAWWAAQTALTEMQTAVEPYVEITHREDPPHDGNWRTPSRAKCGTSGCTS